MRKGLLATLIPAALLTLPTDVEADVYSCRRYGHEAVKQYNRNVEMGCNFWGPRWHANSVSMTDHNRCYGKMFTDVLPPIDLGVQSGKLFSFQVENIGLVRGQRDVSIDIDEWHHCRHRVDFDHCYKLSLGTLTLQSAIRAA